MIKVNKAKITFSGLGLELNKICLHVIFIIFIINVIVNLIGQT